MGSTRNPLPVPKGAIETPVGAVQAHIPDRCLLYYITDRTAFAHDEPTRRRRLLEKIAEAARAGVHYIQLREKDLPTRELESLAREVIRTISEIRKLTPDPRPLTPAFLINSRTDIALAVGADGVHLRSDDVSPREVSAIQSKDHVGTTAFRRPPAQSGAATEASTMEYVPRSLLTGVSCHRADEVADAAASGASFAVFAPVFEKRDAPGTPPAGLAQLREACRVRIPILALGGVTVQNAKQCLEAGAAGIAAIRLFQENDVAKIVQSLRQLA